jgi:hypothetical protein
MNENDYTFKASIGSISIEAHGPREFVQPIYESFKPILDKEIKILLRSPKHPEEQEEKGKLDGGGFPKKASIKDFYIQKQPSSDIQAATLVAFFYSEMAEQQDRSASIDADLLEKGFKACGHTIPENPSQTLRNAKNYGYLDSAGEAGKFKLTPTGYNLVAHSLPTGETVTIPKKRRRANKVRPPKQGR